MNTQELMLVTLVAEPVLEESITEELLELGATGYTIGDIRGRGSRGMHAADVPGHGVRIETLVSRPVAERILEHAARAWFPHYGVVAWSVPAQVVRGEKYVKP